jgi:AcrR family transcriptional regulator
MTDKTTDKVDPRETILRAAAERILHYGYGKTTMSEIAGDCSMSAGNIYRFYPSKIDIAEAMTRKFADESNEAFRQIVRDTARSSTGKLYDFFNFRLERTFRLFERNPKLMELAEIMARERPEYLAEEYAQERRFVEQILEAGETAGDIVLQDGVTITADLVQCATMKFRFPQLWTTEKLSALQFELDGILRLLFTGLAARR